MNETQETFSQGGAVCSEEERKETVKFCAPYSPLYCPACEEFSILNRIDKEFTCQLCGTAIECLSYDKQDRKNFVVKIQRDLMVDMNSRAWF